jgi:hypothetical protein
MNAFFSVLLIGILSVSAVACSSEDEAVEKPVTFGDSCQTDVDCGSGFRCLQPLLDDNAKICTRPCTADDQCPDWHQPGHCEDARQSNCLSERDAGVCLPLECD